MTGPQAEAAESVRDRAIAAVARHAPEYRGLALRPLGGGLDHHAFVVGELIVRVAELSAGADVVREAALLRLVARHLPLPVPVPLFADARLGVLGYPLLPGRPLLGHRPPADAAARLGRFLRALHGVDLAEVGDRAPADSADPQAWLENLDGPAPLVRIVRATIPPPARDLTLTHADLGAEHILVHDGRLSGVIDWSDAEIADPALDFARLYRDFGPAFLDKTLDAYGAGFPDRDRITFFARCCALEDLAYGQATGREQYTHAAQRSLTWLFPGQPIACLDEPKPGRGSRPARAAAVRPGKAR